MDDLYGFASSKRTNKVSIKSKYKGSVSKGFVISTEIIIGNAIYHFGYEITNSHVILFDFAKNGNYATLYYIEKPRVVAKAIYKVVKEINKKTKNQRKRYQKKIKDTENKEIKVLFLEGRTIDGINKELRWHFRFYSWNTPYLKDHANPADIGSTNIKNSGYDYNAKYFEPKFAKGDAIK